MTDDARDLSILVFATKYAIGHPEPPCDTPISFVATCDAFTTQYVTDAHFVAYETPIQRRLTIQSIGIVPIQITLLVADVDDTEKEKGRARDNWREEERIKIAKLLRKHPGAFIYETRGGYRIVFRIPQPFEIRGKEDKTRWWAHYGAFRTHIATTFSISIDKTCKDFTRHYRLPLVNRDGVREAFPVYGDPRVLEALEIKTPELPKKPSRIARRHLEEGVAKVRNAVQGTRNDTLNRVAFALGGFVPHALDRTLVYESLLHAILANGGDAEKDGIKIDAAIDSGMTTPRADEEPPRAAKPKGKEPEPPEPPSDDESTDVHRYARFTDVANAARLVEFFGNDLRFVKSWEKWISWDGKRWRRNAVKSQAMHFAVLTAKRLMEEACTEMQAAAELMKSTGGRVVEDESHLNDDNQKRALRDYKKAKLAIDWAKKTHFSPRLEAMLNVARSDPRISLNHDDLDVDPWLLNVDNGTISLRNGTIRHHAREDLITKLSPVPYDPEATSPIWEKFLSVVTNGNRDFELYLSRAVGYAITGETREHVLFFFHGDGANGKSTFLNTIHTMLGDYAGVAPRSLLFQNKGERHPTEYATLCGARFVTCSEIGEGQRFDESLVKDLTGGDPIECRRMREDFWKFLPTHKLFIAGNHKPQVKGNDVGIWRRIRLVPWEVQIHEKEKDKEMPVKLRGELPGILAWAVRACLDWQKNGLPTPKNVTEATDDYRAESDMIGEFFGLRCTFREDHRIACQFLREEYERFCKDRGEKFPMGPRLFAQKIRRHGMMLGVDIRSTTKQELLPSADGRKVAKIVNAWSGIRLLTDAELAQLAEA